MGIWGWLSGSRATRESAGAARGPIDASTLGIQTTTEWLEADIAGGRRRVTELLNEGEEISVWVRDATAEGDGSGRWRSIATDSILFVVPPPHSSDRQLQIHRRLRRLAIVVGPYRVKGRAHLTPGAEIDPYLLRRTERFVPLTEAVVAGGTLPGPQAAPVVIVNTAHLEELEELS